MSSIHGRREQGSVLRPHRSFRSHVQIQLSVPSWCQGTKHHGQDVGPHGHLELLLFVCKEICTYVRSCIASFYIQMVFIFVWWSRYNEINKRMGSFGRAHSLKVPQSEIGSKRTTKVHSLSASRLSRRSKQDGRVNILQLQTHVFSCAHGIGWFNLPIPVDRCRI